MRVPGSFFALRDIIVTLKNFSEPIFRPEYIRLQNLVEDGRIPSWKSTHDRVVASRANENRLAGIHRKGGGAYDRLRDHYGFPGDYRLADFLWWYVHCIVCLSRQEK